jgi:hypothetical protein
LRELATRIEVVGLDAYGHEGSEAPIRR